MGYSAQVMNWGRLARVYDLQLWLEGPSLGAALELAAVEEGERLLDVGTGTGAVLRELARREPRPGEAVGVDVSGKMLARVPDLPPGWRLERADARRLPFPDASFEVATVAYLLHLLDAESLSGVLSEIRRVLVPGGRLVTVTPVVPRSRLGPLAGALARAGAALLPFLLAGLRPYDPRADLAAAGFHVRRAEYVARGYRSLCAVAAKPS